MDGSLDISKIPTWEPTLDERFALISASGELMARARALEPGSSARRAITSAIWQLGAAAKGDPTSGSARPERGLAETDREREVLNGAAGTLREMAATLEPGSPVRQTFACAAAILEAASSRSGADRLRF